MKKIVLFLVVLSILAVGGFYGSAWFGTYQLLQSLKSDMAEVGVLKWERIAPSYEGRVRIDELQLTLFELNQPFRVGSVVFNAGSPQALLNFLFDQKAKWPPLAELSINELQLILRPELTKTWATENVAEAPQWPRPWHLRACGDHRILGGSDLMVMGIDVVDLDINLRWKNVSSSGAMLSGEFNAGALGSVDFMMRSEALPQRFAELSTGLPGQWEALHLVIRDGGFMRRLAAFCARERFGSPEDWARVATDELNRELKQWGVQPGTRLTALYRQWLHKGGSVSLELPPNRGASLVSPQAVADYLEREDLILLYNDKRVSGIDITLVVDDFFARSAPPEPESPATPPPADTAQWRTTPLVSAPQWLERRVRVSLTSGRSLEGRLSAINERQLQVARNLEGGEFASSAALGEVTGFEVWRRDAETPVILPAPSEQPAQGLEREPAGDEASVSESPVEEPLY